MQETGTRLLPPAREDLTRKMQPARTWMTEKYFVPTEVGIEIKRL